MRSVFIMRASVVITAFLGATVCLFAQNPGTETPVPGQAQGIPPRATPGDYQFKAQAGNLTIAAEFLGHSIPTSQGTVITEDYVVVEAAVFGPDGARAALAASDFMLRINGRTQPLQGAHFGLVFSSLKDPEWGPTPSETAKSKTSVGGQGGGGSEPPPLPPKMPVPLRRAMEQRVQKAALPEGDRALPQAGLVFFQYRGKADGIHSVELTYNGAGGKATLALQ
jgi:hypothetical protein